ncbi:3TM-type holin [Mesorhizobium sp. 1M-11]|uniref:3TM-type holin n=1 Tax=Mesorhizobium sp. 1M-11 TaxID=1529006 RepID=UPI0006C74194|nr:3TM-type holin [Mesorhizobium sp. 1M-11]
MLETVIAGALIDAAAKAGAPLVKDLLEKYLGGTAADIGGAIIDVVAQKAGVEPAALPNVPADELQEAVLAAEAETPELLIQWNTQQRQAIDLMKAEMDKGGPAWTWAWRPAGMWIFIGLFAWYVAGLPVVNLILGLAGAGERLGLIVDVGTLTTMFMFFSGFYMGGHMAESIAGKLRDAISGRTSA